MIIKCIVVDTNRASLHRLHIHVYIFLISFTFSYVVIFIQICRYTRYTTVKLRTLWELYNCKFHRSQLKFAISLGMFRKIRVTHYSPMVYPVGHVSSYETENVCLRYYKFSSLRNIVYSIASLSDRSDITLHIIRQTVGYVREKYNRHVQRATLARRIDVTSRWTTRLIKISRYARNESPIRACRCFSFFPLSCKSAPSLCVFTGSVSYFTTIWLRII